MCCAPFLTYGEFKYDIVNISNFAVSEVLHTQGVINNNYYIIRANNFTAYREWMHAGFSFSPPLKFAIFDYMVWTYNIKSIIYSHVHWSWLNSDNVKSTRLGGLSLVSTVEITLVTVTMLKARVKAVKIDFVTNFLYLFIYFLLLLSRCHLNLLPRCGCKES